MNQIFLFVPAQAQTAELANAAIEFPPMQKCASFNLDAVKARIEQAMRQHAGE